MFAFTIAFTIINIAIEVFLCSHFPWLRKALSKNFFVAFIFSVGLSKGLTSMFDTSGLIAGASGLASTILMIPIYKAWGLVDLVKENTKKASGPKISEEESKVAYSELYDNKKSFKRIA